VDSETARLGAAIGAARLTTVLTGDGD